MQYTRISHSTFARFVPLEDATASRPSCIGRGYSFIFVESRAHTYGECVDGLNLNDNVAFRAYHVKYISLV